MTRDQLLAFVLVVCIFNGIFSPWVLIAVINAPAWMPGFLPYSPGVLFYGSSLLISTMTLLVAGLPAALAERLLDEVTPTAAVWIWLAAAVVMSIPALEAAIALL